MERHSGVVSRHERRASPRVKLRVHALYDAAFTYGTARCRNVSATGLALEGSSSLPIGTEIDVYFELPTGVAVDERARVVRQSDDELGLCFVNASHTTVAALRSFVVARKLKQYGNRQAS